MEMYICLSCFVAPADIISLGDPGITKFEGKTHINTNRSESMHVDLSPPHQLIYWTLF